MDAKIVAAIEFLASKIKEGVSADEALKYTQAAVNICNAGALLSQFKDKK